MLHFFDAHPTGLKHVAIALGEACHDNWAALRDARLSAVTKLALRGPITNDGFPRLTSVLAALPNLQVLVLCDFKASKTRDIASLVVLPSLRRLVLSSSCYRVGKAAIRRHFAKLPVDISFGEAGEAW